MTRGKSSATTLASLAYPIADLILLGLLVAAFATNRWRFTRSWVCLGAGLLAFLVTDSLFLAETAAGTYTVGTVIDTGWLLAAALVAVAAWQPMSGAAVVRLTGWRVLGLPIAFGGVSLGVLFWDHFERLDTV